MIYTVYKEAMEDYEAQCAVESGIEPELPLQIPAKVMRAGVGPINKKDIEMAKLAGARILLFNVGITKDVVKQCKKEGLKVFRSDLMEEIVDIIVKGKKLE